MLRISNIKIQFQINSGPRINAWGDYLKISRVDLAFIWTRRLFRSRPLIEKIRYRQNTWSVTIQNGNLPIQQQQQQQQWLVEERELNIQYLLFFNKFIFFLVGYYLLRSRIRKGDHNWGRNPHAQLQQRVLWRHIPKVVPRRWNNCI